MRKRFVSLLLAGIAPATAMADGPTYQCNLQDLVRRVEVVYTTPGIHRSESHIQGFLRLGRLCTLMAQLPGSYPPTSQRSAPLAHKNQTPIASPALMIQDLFYDHGLP